MDKFTQLKPTTQQTPEILFNGKHQKIAQVDDWEVNWNDNDSIIVIPYFEDTMEFVMRREVVPPYRFKDGEEKHLVCVAGGMEKGESPEDAMFRELFEETGIVVKTSYDRQQKLKTLFSNKGSVNKYHIFFLPLMSHEYDEMPAITDGSTYEKLADTVKIHVGHLNNIAAADTVSALCIELLKNQLRV